VLFCSFVARTLLLLLYHLLLAADRRQNGCGYEAEVANSREIALPPLRTDENILNCGTAKPDTS
jgi:hypothetical protein